ncbi:MAG: fumarylacetoacetase [Planctomycetes bacterium]|nr:fumarylacetoacetase [Planctomycetota bacterium]
MDPTTDPDLKSFLSVSTESHFPIQNLPYGIFRSRPGAAAHVGVAIGDFVLDLAVVEGHRLLDVPSTNGQNCFDQPSLNAFMQLGRSVWRSVRERVSELLRDDTATLRDNESLRRQAIFRMDEVEMLLPVEIGDYTDFYSSREHATNVGSMFRPDNPLLPNWLHLPVAYHGRASSVVVSGTNLTRPLGQTMPEDADSPVFGPSRRVDFELEVGYVIGAGNELGEPIPVNDALDHIFGMVLVNDWSARDIQKWEYVPLGPFLSKNFGTSISPWVVTLDALKPFRTDGPVQEPTPLPYLQTDGNPTIDLELEVWLQTEAMSQPHRISATNLRHMYWNIQQQIAHHTITGCNLRPGDLLATGTVSGSARDARGCLLELTWGGKQPLDLPGGQTRRFLDDGDRVTITGWCNGGSYRVGFGEVTGLVEARG